MLVLATAQVAAADPPTVLVEKLTGPGSPNDTEARFGLKATDVGLMWEDSRGRILTAFGDSYGSGWTGPGGPGDPFAPGMDWRCNTLAVSTDNALGDGMRLDSMITDQPGHAKQVLPCKKEQEPQGEHTVIPTGGVSIGDKDYLAYMTVRQWKPGGEWLTNWGGIAGSSDGGQNWADVSSLRWVNNIGYTDRFQQLTFVKRSGYVYVFGTPNGRNGSVYVARVLEADFEHKDSYRYWNGSDWVAGSDEQAVPISGPAGELSVQYSEYSRTWLMMNLDNARAEIVLREATNPQGPWTGRRVVVSGQNYPGLYGGFIHPWSTSTCDLYFTMSQWDPYNVFLMRTPLGSADSRSTTRVNIPDASSTAPGTPVASNVTLANCARQASHQTAVDVHIKHTYVGDLKITLRGPNGFSKVLKSPDQSDGRTALDATYTVDASATIANGQWSLEVQDTAWVDTGDIESWAITA